VLSVSIIESPYLFFDWFAFIARSLLTAAFLVFDLPFVFFIL